jgi:serine/threonine-protein kinase
MPSFEIPDGPTLIALKNQTIKGKAMRAATATFTVTNKTTQTLTCRLKPAPQGDTKAEWLDVQGEKERPFAASQTQKVNVDVALPVDTKPGEYKFRLQAVNVNDPNSTATGKQPDTVLSQNPSGKVTQVGAVKLTVDPGVSVPDLSGADLQSAINQLGAKGLNVAAPVGTNCRVSGPFGVVVGQDPSAGGNPVALNSTVKLTLSAPIFSCEIYRAHLNEIISKSMLQGNP